MADYDDLAAAFADGDVLYGLDVPRAAARQAILGAGGVSATTSVTKMYLCCIPGKTTTRTNVMIQNDMTNAVWDAQNPNVYASNKSIGKTLSDSARGTGFKDFLDNHPKYNVANSFSTGALTQGSIGDTRKAWGRTSKGGLEYQTSAGRTVHFVITDLKLNDIATKTGYGGKGNITSAEMRWLYRHRATPEVQNHVRFWKADGEVSQATVFGDSSWASYQPTHEYGPAENAIRTALTI